MGDSRRFDLFAKLIKNHISNKLSIADVSGGQGYLQLALREQGFNNIKSFDKRYNKIKSKNINYKYGYFDCNTSEIFEAIVAMHPDEGTDHALMYSIKHKVPSIICPCCVKPSATNMFLNHNFSNWKKHLQSLAEKAGAIVNWQTMKMVGKNEVMIVKWR